MPARRRTLTCDKEAERQAQISADAEDQDAVRRRCGGSERVIRQQGWRALHGGPREGGPGGTSADEEL